MLPRTLEPEVMDTVEEAVDYDSMNHSDVNRRFVDDFILAADRNHVCLDRSGVSMIDLGSGTALIPLELNDRLSQSPHIVACDLSVEMLKLAEQHLRTRQVANIRTLHCDCKQLPFDQNSQDVVISNSIIHHIPEPMAVFRECVRVLKPGGLMFIRDLMRPDSADDVEQLVNMYAADENSHQQQMFRQSLHAALTVSEVAEQLQQLGVPSDAVSATSDRHWTITWRCHLAD